MFRDKAFYSYAWRELLKRINEHNIFGYGAQMAYFFVLSVFPFMIFLFGMLTRFSMSYGGFFDGISKIVPKEVIMVIRDYASAVAPRANANFLSVTALITIWSASRGIHELRQAMNRAYGVKNVKKYWRKRFISIIYTIALMISIVFALTLPSMGKDFVLFMEDILGFDLGFIEMFLAYRWLFIIGFFFAVISFFYYASFDRHDKWRDVIPGTLFAMAGWVALSAGFSMFVNNFGRYTIIYGSLAAMVVLMVWLYMSSIVLMLGGEINSIYYSFKARESNNGE
ncbi:MAG: YihY/virulence factor BrkB family protein [Peptostreptococcaceae bacterium]|nr:YihY/virulence factor BrkB family protein [Peptostreptococcaceae bacterium]